MTPPPPSVLSENNYKLHSQVFKKDRKEEKGRGEEGSRGGGEGKGEEERGREDKVRE